MTDANWPTLLADIMDRANVSLQRGNRQAAAASMAQASELLFLQARKSDTLDDKERFVKRAGQLLDASLALRGDAQGGDAKGGTAEKQAASATTGCCAGGTMIAPQSGRGLMFADIAGLDGVKQTLLQRIIYPMRHPEKLQKYQIRTGGGMLLDGSPGTGKSLLARAVAGELGLPFFVIKSSEVLSQYYGQSEKQLADLFDEARGQPNGSVVFLDEIDALGAKRTEQMNEASRRVINQLLQELDGVGGRSERLVFLAATNEPWLLDAALLRPPRFCEKCYIPLPDDAARRVLFDMALKDCPLAGDVSMETLAARSQGLSGADIVNVCERAKVIPFCESINTGIDRPITAADFDEAMRDVRPSVGVELLRRFDDWGRKY
jgi:transitional endoplasmic reticulum ATPase